MAAKHGRTVRINNGLRILGVLALAAAGALCLVGCGGGGGGAGAGGTVTPPPVLTDQQAQQIQTSAAQIDQDFQEAVQGADIAAELANLAQQLRGSTGIGEAYATPNSLSVEYVDGGRQTWLNNPVLRRPPYWPEGRLRLLQVSRELVGGQKAAVVNCVSDDEGMSAGTEVFSSMATLLDELGYDVDVVGRQSADLNFFKTLYRYAVVFLYAHGGAGTSSQGAPYANLQTGEEHPSDLLAGTADLIAHAYAWKVAGTIELVSVDWGTVDREDTSRDFWAVTGKFFQDYYSSPTTQFPHSLFYSGACSGAKNTALSGPLAEAGVAAYVAWTDTTAVSPWAGLSLLGLMASGQSLGDAWDDMPDDAMSYYYNTAGTTARLAYAPDSAHTLQLADPRTIPISLVIDSPVDGDWYQERVVTLAGAVHNAPDDAVLSAFINGRGIALDTDTEGLFEHDTVLSPGNNLIEFVATSSVGTARHTVTVYGDFPALDLWTQLIWDEDNTDVDFHLLPPGRDLDDLWTSSDCYYSNKRPGWGAELDVDDVNGYGPEHITLPSADAGTYTLAVHYYSDHGTGRVPWCQVHVVNNREELMTFYPGKLHNSASRGGDVWEVCKISFPSGAITPVDTVTTRQSGRLHVAPTKPNSGVSTRPNVPLPFAPSKRGSVSVTRTRPSDWPRR